MSNQDPIANMLCSINNAVARSKGDLFVPASKEKESILEVFKKQGFIVDYAVEGEIPQKKIRIALKYDDHGQSVLKKIVRVSKPSRRITSKSDEIPRVQGGMGVAILHTNKGVLTDHEARKLCVGGEIICYVYS